MIELHRGDITILAVDAVVNAAKPSLLGGGGVDGAIHRAAGPELLAACRPLGGCATGDAKITPGFQLAARWVIHAVGPVWHEGGQGEPQLLNSSYTKSLQLALEHQVRSIAFPAISTGVYGYPKQAAAEIAIAAMRQYETQIDRIIACCHGQEDYAIYQRILGGHTS